MGKCGAKQIVLVSYACKRRNFQRVAEMLLAMPTMFLTILVAGVYGGQQCRLEKLPPLSTHFTFVRITDNCLVIGKITT